MKTLQLYSLATPNGQKIGIALEEMELPYEAHLIDIAKGEQFAPDYVKINPNSKIPSIVDPDGPGGQPLSIMESGSILIYLAEKSGRFLNQDPRFYGETLQWLFFQAAHIGPMFGQFGHFYHYAKNQCEHPYPVERYTNETRRLLGVLEKRLFDHKYMVQDDFSIADMAIAPWVKALDVSYNARTHLRLDQFPRVEEWLERVWARPGVQRGILVCRKPE